jgi:hypothetical protein
MTVHDPSEKVIVSVPHARNSLYPAHLSIIKPVCLLAHAGDAAWLWHAQDFQGLECLASQEMVRDMPRIEHPEQLCDVCLAGKQRRATFPQVARFRAMMPLWLVHGDLCSPISPVTQGGQQYFLLLVEDHSRLMWLTLLCTKDEAAEAIR